MKTAYQFNIENMQKTVPAMAFAGGNLADWQKIAREKLADLLGMDKFAKVAPEMEIEYEQKMDGATDIRFTFQTEAGFRVPCHLWLPDGVENPPVIICLQGHSKGMHISLGRPIYDVDPEMIGSGDRDFCVRALKEGFAAIAMEQRNFGILGGHEKGTPQCVESSMTALLMGRTTVGERVWDVSRLIDLIEAEFADKVDVNKICLMGHSGGGTTTAYTAALDCRIVLAMPSCAMCTYKDSIGSIKHCPCNFIPNIANIFDMSDLMAMAYPKFFVQVSGLEDSYFRLSGVKEVFAKGKAAYKAGGDDSRCTLIIGNGGHRFYADEAWDAVHKYLG
ncbi:MAG: hypothetical protein IJZ08_06685 [Clostridia bacterium]|nr:hypothetical protein [Clostridia bacterium]